MPCSDCAHPLLVHLGRANAHPSRSLPPSLPPSLPQANELLGGSLISLHNVFFMNRLMTAIRESIPQGAAALDEEEKRWVR
jgi:hypothetical protein